MWFSRFPGANASDTAYQTLVTGPANASTPAGFYGALLELRRWWKDELAAEGMMELQLPSPASTNGTYLATQAMHSIVKSMITRQRTFHPRFGVKPGFGSDNTHGYPDVMTSTVAAALEMGALPYAKGVIGNYFQYYVREDGMLHLPSIALPATCRVLTTLAMLHGFADADNALLLTFFVKAKALAEWLASRRALSLVHPPTDPRHGIPQGEAHADNNVRIYALHMREPPYLYASAAEMYRAFTDMGAVWQHVGQASRRDDVAQHGAELSQLAAKLFQDLHASLNRTVHTTGVAAAARCWPMGIDGSGAVFGQGGAKDAPPGSAKVARPHPPPLPPPSEAIPHREYPAMLYSSAMTARQVEDIYRYMNYANRSLNMGVPGFNSSISSRAPFGLAYAVLQHDMVERFLLHFYTLSAHSYTRGHWTPTGNSNLADRDAGAGTYTTTSAHAVPMCVVALQNFGVYARMALLYAPHARACARGVCPTTRKGGHAFMPSHGAGAWPWFLPLISGFVVCALQVFEVDAGV